MARLGDERRELVRQGYDRAGGRYHDARPLDGGDVALLAEIHSRIRPAARILDVGCGSGVPVARCLVALGHSVVGVDISFEQLTLARTHVVSLKATEGEMLTLPIGNDSLDALVSYYAVIHVPREDHAGVFGEFHRVLRAGGWALVCIGSNDNPGDRDDDSWLGTPMYWSHYDADATVDLISGAGLVVESTWEVPDPMGHGAHRFVLAQAM